MKKIRVFFSTIKEGISGMWQHRTMGIASIISIALVLIILGAVILTTLILNQAVLDIQVKVDQVDILLDSDVSEEEVENIENYIRTNKEVKSYTFHSSEDNLEEFSESIEVEGYLFEGMEDAFPSSFIVKVDDIAYTEDLVKEMKNFDGIDNIRYYKDVIRKMIRISDVIQLAGIITVSILIFISILIISNTIKLAVFARKKEIEIKKYIGASNPVITNPFLIEGFFFGLFGSIIASLTLYFGYNYFYDHYGSKMLDILSTYLVRPEMLYFDLGLIFIVLGIGIGMLGSLFSIRRYINV